MILVRKAKDRGETKTNWLQSFHTFSFADYYDPQFLGFGNLLVINEDTVQPGFGFGTHAHKDMEIITYVITGTIEHKDSMGQVVRLMPGEIQRMSAGQGLRHSEINPSKKEILHFLQIWIIPKEKGLVPSYEQKEISKDTNKLILIGSTDSGDSNVQIHQDVNLYYAKLFPGSSIAYNFDDTSYGWLQVISGNLMCGENLSAGDGMAIIDQGRIQIECQEPSEFLLFDFMRKTEPQLAEHEQF